MAVGRGVRMELGVAATAVFVANGVRDGRSATMGAAGAGVVGDGVGETAVQPAVSRITTNRT
ncbi:MAG: hypothetical protein KC425_11875 [Anaerolineales bacterium]|nr:hypothetical protein [Anaerolineales bacterium]